jgi:hypothetical protein
MSLLPSTPRFLEEGFRVFTGLFRPKSEPEPLLNHIQQSAEVYKNRIDEAVKEAQANKNNLEILSNPDPDDPQLKVQEMELLLANDAIIGNAIADSVGIMDQQYEQAQTSRFNQELDAFRARVENEEQYKIQCRQGIQVELRDALTGCFITPQERLLPYAYLSLESHKSISEYFDEHCSQFAEESVGRVTDSWLPDVSPHGAETFFKRTALYLDAFKTYNVFNTPPWRQYKSYENARMTQELPAPPQDFWSMQYEREWNDEFPLPQLPPPPLPHPTSFPPPGGPANQEYLNYKTKIDPYYYVVGPIVEFEHLEGRTLIYVKCYDDETYTTGIYFWVYLSQSEGLFRVFFKLRANSIIEKGFDYTQGTLVDFRLQVILSRYYNTFYFVEKPHPIRLNTLKRVVYFLENMPYLQSNFLNNFPLPLIIRRDDTQRCYVGTPPKPYVRDTLGRVQGLEGDFYLIDKKYNSIFHQGFPLVFNEIINFFPDSISPDYHYCAYLISKDLVTQRSEESNKFKDFLRGRVSAQPFTEPLIYCFTTSCPKTTLVSFTDLLNVMNYTATIWLQGLQNFTRMFDGILSPVLYVVIGAMVESPDIDLSSIRDQMLGVTHTGIGEIQFSNMRDYKKHLSALMTLGTEGFQPTDPTLYLPATPPTRKVVLSQHGGSRKIPPTNFKDEIQAQIEHVKFKAADIFTKILPDIPPNQQGQTMKQLIDLGLLSIKADWLKRKFDDSYQAFDSVFPDEVDETIDFVDGTSIKKIELYCLCNDNTFLKLPDSRCLDPETPFIKTLSSKFNETRIDYGELPYNEKNVVVHTLSQQYCMKFSYVKTPELQVKEMYVMMQLSSTIVYTVATPTTEATPTNKILYAIDMQKTPIACLPEYRLNETSPEKTVQYFNHLRVQAGGAKKNKGNNLSTQPAAPYLVAADGVGKPEVVSKQEKAVAEQQRRAAEQQRRAAAAEAEQQQRKAAEALVMEEQNKILRNLHAVLTTDRTMLSTPKRVASWGGFFAGKMMEYLFGQYFQTPSIFNLYASKLRVCHAYCTTALMYNYNTSRPSVFFNTIPPAGKSYSFADLFVKYFEATEFQFQVPPTPAPYLQETVAAYIKRRLVEHTAEIVQVGQKITAPFLDSDFEKELLSVADSTSPSRSMSSHGTSPSVTGLMLGKSLSSDDESDPDYRETPSQSRSRSLSPVGLDRNLPNIQPPMGNGGSLTKNKSIKKGKNKRKNIKTTRKTTRKNGKVNRIIKKHNKKRKTYKCKRTRRKSKGRHL